MTLSPTASNVFADAVHWLEGILLGTLASAVAVVAVASVGFLLLAGRIDVRRAAQVIFGCFILFGASTIASGLMTALAVGFEPDVAVQPPAPAYPVAPPQTVRSVTPYDPYAGAALPSRR